jgi:hypothetical protein
MAKPFLVFPRSTANDIENSLEDCEVDFPDECTAVITWSSPVIFNLMRQFASDACRTNGRTFSGMFYNYVDMQADAFTEDPDNPKFRMQTSREVAEAFRNATRNHK